MPYQPGCSRSLSPQKNDLNQLIDNNIFFVDIKCENLYPPGTLKIGTPNEKQSSNHHVSEFFAVSFRERNHRKLGIGFPDFFF